MKKIGLFSLFVIISFLGMAQNITVKKDCVYQDGQPIFWIKRINATLYSVDALDGKRLAVLNIIRIANPTTATSTSTANRGGRTTTGANTSSTAATSTSTTSYYDVTFMDAELSKCEIQMNTKKGIAKEWIHFNLINGNELNEHAVQQYVRIHGTKLQELYKTPKNTVIINQ